MRCILSSHPQQVRTVPSSLYQEILTPYSFSQALLTCRSSPLPVQLLYQQNHTLSKMYFQIPAILALYVVSTVVASPLPVEKRDIPNYSGLPSNVLFMFQNTDCKSLQAKEAPLSDGFSLGSEGNDLYHAHRELGMQRTGDFGGHMHTYLDLTSDINYVHTFNSYTGMGINTIVWTIDEPRYNFRAWRGVDQFSVNNVPDDQKTIWLVVR